MKKNTILAVVFSTIISTTVSVSAPVTASKRQVVEPIDVTVETTEPVVVVETPGITYIEEMHTYIPEKKDKKKKKKQKKVKENTTKVVTASSNTEYDDLDLLAHCVQAEAGNQGLYGKQLVVDVILNRVDSDRFPNSIKGVITQKNQFAVWSSGAIHKAKPDEETYDAIELELAERTDSTIVFFTAGKYNPSGTPAYKHGNHYFSTL